MEWELIQDKENLFALLFKKFYFSCDRKYYQHNKCHYKCQYKWLPKIFQWKKLVYENALDNRKLLYVL